MTPATSEVARQPRASEWRDRAEDVRPRQRRRRQHRRLFRRHGRRLLADHRHLSHAGQSPQHHAPDRAADDRRGRDDLRHHDRRASISRLARCWRSSMRWRRFRCRPAFRGRWWSLLMLAVGVVHRPPPGLLHRTRRHSRLHRHACGPQRHPRLRALPDQGLFDPDRSSDSPFNVIGRGWVFGIPLPAIIAVVVLASPAISSSTKQLSAAM